MRLVVGMTGATGAPLGTRLLEALHALDEVETHLVLSRWARTTLELETPHTARDITELADVVHRNEDQTAPISSGSFRTDGMVVVPCSVRTLAGIRSGHAGGLIARAVNVVLEEGRKLVLVPRESPLSEAHLANMLDLARMGAVILPPMPAFYDHPRSIDDVLDHTVAQVLDQFGLLAPRARRSDLFDAREGDGHH